jgi:hypothetical protein
LDGVDLGSTLLPVFPGLKPPELHARLHCVLRNGPMDFEKKYAASARLN